MVHPFCFLLFNGYSASWWSDYSEFIPGIPALLAQKKRRFFPEKIPGRNISMIVG
jgi:hypothetical protein